MLIMTGLRSRVVLITGAVSRIGRATALSFAKSGAKLALIGLKREAEDSSEELHASKKLGEIAKECQNLGAADVHIGQYDVSKREGCRSAIEEALERFRGTIFKIIKPISIGFRGDHVEFKVIWSIMFTDNLNVLVNISAILPPEDAASASLDDEHAFEKVLSANLMTAVR